MEKPWVAGTVEDGAIISLSALGALGLFLSMALLSHICCSMGQPLEPSCAGRAPALVSQPPSCSPKCLCRLQPLWTVGQAGEQIPNPLSNPWAMGITLQDAQNVGRIEMGGMENPPDAASMSCPQPRELQESPGDTPVPQ